MPDRSFTGLWALAGAALLLAAATAAAWGLRPAASVAAGGAWNLASLWCFTRLLRAWLGPHPSRRRVVGWSHHLSHSPQGRDSAAPNPSPSATLQVVGWLLVKFPLLYSLVWLALRAPAFSWAGFGVGFSVVLLVAVGWFAVRAQRLAMVRVHVR